HYGRECHHDPRPANPAPGAARTGAIRPTRAGESPHHHHRRRPLRPRRRPPGLGLRRARRVPGHAHPPAYFERSQPELPASMRYFRGNVPEAVTRSGPWPARFRRVTGRVEIAPGIHVVANRDPDGPYRETPELSLVLETPEGQVLVVGCSHPGIERILVSVDALPDVHPRILRESPDRVVGREVLEAQAHRVLELDED